MNDKHKRYIVYALVALLALGGIGVTCYMFSGKKNFDGGVLPDNFDGAVLPDNFDGAVLPDNKDSSIPYQHLSALDKEPLPLQKRPAAFIESLNEMLDCLKSRSNVNNLDVSQQSAIKANLDVVAGKDCIVVLGDTGAGKSTLLNAICQGPGNMVEVDEKGKEISYSKDKQAIIYLRPKNSLKKDGKTLFQVMSGIKSATKYPEVYEWQSKVLCDCPGFNDKGGVEKELLHSLVIGSLLKGANRVKLCFLIPEKHFVGKGDRQGVLEDMLDTLYALLKADADFESNLAKVQIVVSCPSGQLKKQYIVEKLGEILREKLRVKQGVIDAILSNLMFVDAADRSYVFVDEEKGYLSSSSPSQDKVGALKDSLLADERWIGSDHFKNPLNENARKAMSLLIKDAVFPFTRFGCHFDEAEIKKNKKTCQDFLKTLIACGFSDFQEEIEKAYGQIERFTSGKALAERERVGS